MVSHEGIMKTTIAKEIKGLVTSIKTGNVPYVCCPECGRGGMQEGVVGWECPWRDCNFRTTKIPYTSEIQRLIQLKADLEAINKFNI
jgi:hypothetical protein